MAQKIQFKITNIKFAAEAKNIERHLKDKFDNLYRQFYTQKDKRGNLSIFFNTKNDEILINDICLFFSKTNWKCEYNEL